MQKTFKRVLASGLAAVMALSAFAVSASAAVDNYNPNYDSATHTVFKHTEQTLAPGVTQYTNYAYTKADNKQMVYYVTTADVTRSDVMLQVSYKGMQHDVYGMEKLSDTVAIANAKYSNPDDPDFVSEYYSVVSATNGNGYNMTTGQPSGVWAMGGDVIQEYTGSTAFFAILKDGRAVMGKTVAEWNAYKANPGIEEAINAFGSILVWDGVSAVSATGSYYTDRASRTMMGVTADGKVILIVVDGRQEPFSCGASMAELAQIMLEAGAVYAINLDGGGSTTYMAKNEGTNECVIGNRPSDGSERAISNGLIIASLAAPSDVFDHAVLSVENDYVMPGASVAVSATGVSPAGTAADIPAEVTYTAEYGSVENGVYTAGSNATVDTISMIYDGNVVGTCEVNVVVPDSISFTGTSIACPYGKTTDLGVAPMYGVHEVAFGAQNVNFTLGNTAFGTIDNAAMTFTATSEPLSSTTTTITVATNCTPSVNATVSLQVGKGSEVIWDFEDQSTANMSLFDYYNSGVQGSLEIVNSETGKVHNGDYALAINYDFSQLTYYEDYIDLMFCYNAEAMKAHGNTADADGSIMGGDPSDFIYITGATGIGMWMYIPDEVDAKGLNPRFFFGYKEKPTSAWTRGTSGMKLLVDVQHLPTDNWYYYYADLSAYSSYAALTLQASRSLASNGTTKNGQKGYPTNYYAGPCFEFYVEDSAWKSYRNKSFNSKFTLFIDNYTVDYSSVVDDREAPEFGSAVYATTGMWEAVNFTDGVTMNSNDIDITVEVADATRKLAGGVTAYTPTNNATGIKASSAKAYVDGVEVACTYKNGKIALDKALVLADGVHTVKFTIEDNNGNMGYKNLTFNVATNSGYDTIVVKPHDETLTETPVGSLYYIDLVATDISNIGSVTTTLKVNNVNNWEPAGIETADGFSYSYTTEPGDEGELTLTVTRTGEVADSGEAILASIPIRAWYPHNALGMNSNWIITTKKCVYPMDIQLVTKAGSIVYVNDTDAIGAFSADKIQIDSEAMCEYGYIGVNKGNESGTVTVTSWHEHSAHAVADKPATCTEDGYTGRTFCDDCNSIVDFGTVVPATGHTFELIDGVLKCKDCGELFNGEYTDGKTYADGVALQGFADGKYYVDGVAQDYTGVVEIDGVYYEFDENHTSAGVYTGLFEKDGVNYYARLGELASGWFEVEDDWYYFMPDTFEGANGVVKNEVKVAFTFENGKLLSGVWEKTIGKYRYWYGPTYYHLTSRNVAYLEQEVDGATYLFDSGGYRATGIVSNHESNSRTLNWYDCGEDGKATKLTGPQILHINDKIYYVDENGDSPAGYGLVKVDGDYYFVLYDGSVKRNGDRVVPAELTNGLLPAATYNFDENGKMTNPPVMNGIDENGFYRENGEIVKDKGLVKIGDDYYFIVYNGKIKRNDDRVVPADKTNGLLPTGTYHFGDDGKMTTILNGVDPFDFYYREDGVIQKNKGLVKLGDDYYYVTANGQVKRNGDRLVPASMTNGLLPEGTYNFDEAGKITNVPVLNGVGDDFFYRENGEIIKDKGLVKVGSDYYFVVYNGKVKRNDDRVVPAEKTNGLLPTGTYHFGEDGKMTTVLDGVDPYDFYYREDGVIQKNKGLVKIDGDYYYVTANGQVKRNGDRLVPASMTNGLLPEGTYTFDAAGKITNAPAAN